MNDVKNNPDDPRVDLAHERTDFARFRTQLALDRTTLAWVRTALAMASFGFGTVAFFRTIHEQSPTPESTRLEHGATYFGTGLIVLGIVSTVLAGVSHWFCLRRIRRGEPLALSQWPLSIVLAFLASIIGFGGLWALFVR
jgi:putative membrane protein